MNPVRIVPLRAVLLAAALLAAFQFSAGAPRAHAEGVSFFVAYGTGLEPGSTVGLLVGDNESPADARSNTKKPERGCVNGDTY